MIPGDCQEPRTWSPVHWQRAEFLQESQQWPVQNHPVLYGEICVSTMEPTGVIVFLCFFFRKKTFQTSNIRQSNILTSLMSLVASNESLSPSRTWPVVSDCSKLRWRPMGSPCEHPGETPRTSTWMRNKLTVTTYFSKKHYLVIAHYYNNISHIHTIWTNSCFSEFQDNSSNPLARRSPYLCNDHRDHGRCPPACERRPSWVFAGDPWAIGPGWALEDGKEIPPVSCFFMFFQMCFLLWKWSCW